MRSSKVAILTAINWKYFRTSILPRSMIDLVLNGNTRFDGETSRRSWNINGDLIGGLVIRNIGLLIISIRESTGKLRYFEFLKCLEVQVPFETENATDLIIAPKLVSNFHKFSDSRRNANQFLTYRGEKGFEATAV